MQKKYITLSILVITSCLVFINTVDYQQTFLRKNDNSYHPKSFDLSLVPQSQNCNFIVLSEGICQGGNWAWAFTHAMYLTHCTSTFDEEPILSAEELLTCLPTNTNFDRCSMTLPDTSIVADINSYLSTVGVSYQSCLPYQQFLNAHLTDPTCATSCQDGSDIERVLQGEVFEINGRSEVQDHLLTNGPVIMAIRYKSSLNKYANGVYKVDEATMKKDDELFFGWNTDSDGKINWNAQYTQGAQWAQAGKIRISEDNAYIEQFYGIKLNE